jgi:glycine dehydrogenase subunit 2
MRNTRSTELIFELSKPGCSGARLPKCDVPTLPVAELLPAEAVATEPLPLPELSEPDIVRHFVTEYVGGYAFLSVGLVYDEVQPQAE